MKPFSTVLLRNIKLFENVDIYKTKLQRFTGITRLEEVVSFKEVIRSREVCKLYHRQKEVKLSDYSLVVPMSYTELKDKLDNLVDASIVDISKVNPKDLENYCQKNGYYILEKGIGKTLFCQCYFANLAWDSTKRRGMYRFYCKEHRAYMVLDTQSNNYIIIKCMGGNVQDRGHSYTFDTLDLAVKNGNVSVSLNLILTLREKNTDDVLENVTIDNNVFDIVKKPTSSVLYSNSFEIFLGNLFYIFIVEMVYVSAKFS